MPHPAAPSRWTRSMSRRFMIGAGASTLTLGSLPPAYAQGTPQPAPERPRPEPASGRDSSSWFVTSRPAELDAEGRADRFEVYDGRTFEPRGGFQAAGTGGTCLTANPAKILLSTLTGPSIFDLETGNVTKVAWDVQTSVADVRLPDPRQATPTPIRWSFCTDFDSNGRALLIDLDNATGIDLQEILVKPGETRDYPSIRFAPDGTILAVSVSERGYFLLNPEMANGARLLDGGKEGWISSAPAFSPDSSRLAYVIEPASGRGKPTLVVQDLERDDVVEIGPISLAGFAIFPPDSNDDLIIVDSGTVARREIDGGRDIWEATPEASPLAASVLGNTLLLETATRRDRGPQLWQAIDLDSGESHRLPLLDGLTSFNGSYVNPEPAFRLMGPSRSNPGYRSRLSAVNLESREVTPLLDEINGRGLQYSYATSRDSGVILYTPLNDQQYYLFEIAAGRQRAFAHDGVGDPPDYPAISPDGTTAGFMQRTGSGSGDIAVWLLDVASEGEPEPFIEGRLWLWAGSAPTPAAIT